MAGTGNWVQILSGKYRGTGGNFTQFGRNLYTEHRCVHA